MKRCCKSEQNLLTVNIAEGGTKGKRFTTAVQSFRKEE